MLLTGVELAGPAGGKPKLDRYEWKTRGRPGKLMRLPKNGLYVDRETYQRDDLETKVKELARDWSWPACGALIVAFRRDEQKHYVIDGQHRCLAALRRSDIVDLPCVVFEVDSIREEAEIFLACNTNRRALRISERYRAFLASGDAAAELVNRLITAAGMRATDAPGPGAVRCLASLHKHAKQTPERLEALWPLIVEITGSQYQLHHILVDGLMYIESHLQNGESLRDKRWKPRVLKVGLEALIGGATRAAAYYSKGGSKVWAGGMVETINKGLRDRMHLRGEQD